MRPLAALLCGGWLGLVAAATALAQSETNFAITGIRRLPDNQAELRWTGDTARWYVVERATNLLVGAGFWPCQAVPLFVGPFPFTLTVTDTPPVLASTFYRLRRTDPLGTCHHEFIAFGTPNDDVIVQYGCDGNDLLYAETSGGNDRIEQYGGDGIDTMTAVSGTGDDFVHQDGGRGDDILYLESGDGKKNIVQIGGEGDDTMEITGGHGGGVIEQSAGAGNDTMTARGGKEDDTIRMQGGESTDTLTYDITAGSDLVTLDGGPGDDALTINKCGHANFTIRDQGGNVLFQMGSGGSQITVSNVEHGQVIGDGGEVLYEW